MRYAPSFCRLRSDTNINSPPNGRRTKTITGTSVSAKNVKKFRIKPLTFSIKKRLQKRILRARLLIPTRQDITNPAFAENIPLVGNVFKQLGNSMGFYGDYSKYAKQLTDSAEDAELADTDESLQYVEYGCVPFFLDILDVHCLFVLL